jgi:butyryl-CoA dehydrogenase
MKEASGLTAEQAAFRAEVREFARREIAPGAAEGDARACFPTATFEKLATAGYLGIPVPEEHGGLGKDNLSFVVALEEIAGVCPSTALGVAAHTSLVALPILSFGTEEQQRKYLPDLASGRRLGAFGLTESHGGSDAAATRTRAVRDGRHFIVDGSKAFITNASHAGIFIITARTSDAPGARGITSLIVERGFPGFSVGEREDKLGLRSSDTAEVYFEGCRVPVENRLGPEGQGFYNFMKALDGGRIGIGAMGVGIAQAILDDVVAWLRRRRTGVRPLVEDGATREKIADMATALHASRLLVYDTARRRMRGEPHTLEAAITKLFTSETCCRTSRDAIDLMGLEGCSREHRLERFFRDAKLLEIGEGTSEIQRLVIAREVLDRDA